MIDVEDLKREINKGVKNGDKFLFAINYEMDEAIFIPNPECSSEILWRTPKAQNFEVEERQDVIVLSPEYINYEDYITKFRKIYNGIYNGNSFLANLTVKTPLKESLQLRDIAVTSNSKYLLYLPERFVCFSPEPFVTVSADGVIRSYPMKGTIDATIPDAENILLNDYKERAEHCTIVDLIRSDLSRVATDVEVESFGYIDKLTTNSGSILQMSSAVKGRLLPEYLSNYGDMLLSLLPAGSVSGAPKPTTLKLIESAEGEKRGFYCGVFGYFDGKELDSAVMIRYIEKFDNRFYYRSGGGITINSDAKSEYEEVNAKIYITK